MGKWTTAALAILIVNSAYLAAFPQPTVFYMANVVLHLLLGIGVMVAAIVLLRRFGWPSVLLLIAGLPAIYLAVRGNTLDHRAILWLHIALGLAAVIAIGLRSGRKYWIAASMLILLPATAAVYKRIYPNPDD